MAFTENTDIFLADFGVVATDGADSANVILDMPDQLIAGDVISAEYRITYATGAFTGLGYGDPITVNGESYTVNTVQKIEDGAFTVATLSKT